MERILILNGRLIDPKTQTDESADIEICDGVISCIAEPQSFDIKETDTVIDADGLVVSPGLIDTHTHFRDPGFEYKEDIISGGDAAVHGGYTDIICMANTNPAVDSVETVKYVLEKGESSKARIHTAATITKDMAGKELVDFASLKAAGAKVFTDDGKPLPDIKLVYEAMKKAKEEDVILSFHEEEPKLVGTPGVNDGDVSSKLGLAGAKRSAEDVMVSGDCMLALETGAKICIQHLSSGASVEAIRSAKKLGANVWAEAAPHHFALTEEAVLEHGTLAKMNPPLRTESDRQQIIKGLKDDTIEIIATDHAPHAPYEKEKEFAEAPSGIIGLETALALGLTYLVHKGHLSLSHFISKLTSKPAELYGLDGGCIEKGKVADIVIFDPEEEWILKEEDIASKSKNTPFIGKKLAGKVKCTICGGKIVYRD